MLSFGWVLWQLLCLLICTVLYWLAWLLLALVSLLSSATLMVWCRLFLIHLAPAPVLFYSRNFRNQHFSLPNFLSRTQSFCKYKSFTVVSNVVSQTTQFVINITLMIFKLIFAYSWEHITHSHIVISKAHFWVLENNENNPPVLSMYKELKISIQAILMKLMKQSKNYWKRIVLSKKK